MSKLQVDSIVNAADTGSPTFTNGLICSGVGTFSSQVSIAGTLTYEDVTQVDSVGLVTARTGVKVTAGGLDVTAGGINVAAGVCTFPGNVSCGGSIAFGDGKAKGGYWGTEEDLVIYHDGSQSWVSDQGTGNLILDTNGSQVSVTSGGGAKTSARFVADDACKLSFNDGIKFVTTNTGAQVTGILTATGELSALGGADFAGQLKEGVEITADQLRNGTNVDLANGMVHLYTVAEGLSSTPNIRYDGSTTLASKMAVGETVTVTIITTTTSTSYYCANMSIDGAAQTEEWQGGSAPSAGGGSGYDVYTYNIIKTAATPTYLVLANLTNFA